jgi:arylsulfatase A-like enzyme
MLHSKAIQPTNAAAAESILRSRPHILLMVLDDIGRTDTGIYGPSNIPMPNLVNLATNGIVLENFYTQTVCSPTRSALMTGQYPFRFGMQHFTVRFFSLYCNIDHLNLTRFKNENHRLKFQE